MSRRPRNEIATRDLAKHHRALHRSAGSPTTGEMYRRMVREYDADITEEPIRRLVLGDVDPTYCSLELLLAVCAFYSCTPEELGEAAAHRINTALAMVPHGGPGLPKRESGWPPSVVHLPQSEREAG